MATATLTFHLPDEDEDFGCAMRGKSMAMALFAYDQRLRNKAKYGDGDDAKHYAVMRTELHGYLEEYDIDLDQLLS